MRRCYGSGLCGGTRCHKSLLPGCRCEVLVVFRILVKTATIYFNFVTVVRALSKMAHMKCFFDIEIGGASAGRLIIEVRAVECTGFAVALWRTACRSYTRALLEKS